MAAVHEWLERAGIPLVLVRYPPDLYPVHIANKAIDRLAFDRSIAVLNSRESVLRLAREDRRYIGVNHPNSAMYEEVARDLVGIVDAKVGVYAEPVVRDEATHRSRPLPEAR